MKVYTDIFSNDEMFSDTHLVTEERNGLIFKVKAKLITVSDSVEVNIGANASQDPDAEKDDDEGGVSPLGAGQRSVLDVVEFCHLQQTSFDKTGFVSYIKGYMKRVKAALEEKNPTRVETFTKEAQAFVKDLLANFSEYEFYAGQSLDLDAGVALLFYENDGQDPYFYFLRDGLKEVKL